jgi:hypothetical protein
MKTQLYSQIMSDKSFFIQFKFKPLLNKGIMLLFDMKSPVHIKMKQYSFDAQSFEFKLHKKLFG